MYKLSVFSVLLSDLGAGDAVYWCTGQEVVKEW